MYDEKSNALLAEAKVELRQAHPAGGLVPARTTTTDDAGHFTFEGLRDDELRLLVRAPGYRPWAETLPRPRAGLVLELEPFAAAVEGHVAATEGFPLANAHVRVRDDGQGLAADAVTSAEGAYRVAGVPDLGAEELVVQASAAGRRSVAKAVEPPEPGGTLRLDFELPPGRALGTIEVLASAGGPVADARILCNEPPDRSSPMPSWNDPWVEVARTGSDGRATVAGLPVGACTLSIRSEGYVEEHCALEAQSAPLPAGDSWLKVVLQPSGRVVGRLIDAEGAPIQGLLSFRPASWPAARWSHVQNAMDSYQAWSDADGAFSVEALVPDTPYRLTLDASGHATTAVEREIVVAPGEELDIGHLELQRGRTVTGLVRVEPGTPGTSVRLGAVGVLSHGQIMTWRPVRVTLDGRFEAHAMPLGEFTLRGSLGAIEREVVVLPDQVRVELDLREDPSLTWTLTVRCVDLTGNPVDGVPLVARGEGDAPDAPLVPTGAPGLYELRNVQGLLRLVGIASESEFVSLDPEARAVASSPPTTLRVELAGPVTGRVVADGSGQPIADAEILWRCDPAGEAEEGAGVALRAGCGATGEFVLDVPATRFGELTARAPGFRSASSPLPPVGQMGTRWDAVLQRSSRLVVEVRTDEGAPLANARIVCRGPLEAEGTEETLERRTDVLGRATFELPEEGRYRVELVWGALDESRDVLAIAEGEVRVSFEAAPPGVDVRVLVHDADGSTAVQRAVILADSRELRSARTGSDGVARFEAVAPGDYYLKVMEPDGSGQQSLSVHVQPGAPLEVSFRLE